MREDFRQAEDCPQFELVHSVEQIKENFNRLLSEAQKTSDLGVLGLRYPSLAALIWVLSESPEDSPETENQSPSEPEDDPTPEEEEDDDEEPEFVEEGRPPPQEPPELPPETTEEERVEVLSPSPPEEPEEAPQVPLPPPGEESHSLRLTENPRRDLLLLVVLVLLLLLGLGLWMTLTGMGTK
jgi:hypothetical protein